MRVTRAIWILIVATLASGCDPVGWRRVQLQLRSPEAGNNIVAVDSPDVQEALQILDAIALRQGFHPTESHEPDYIRVYSFSSPPVAVGGQPFIRTTSCHVSPTFTGIFVTFGNGGFLGADDKAESLFRDVRAAFIKKYGRKNVKSHKWGFG